MDYEHTLLQKVYELGDEKLRKQIADKARQTGRVAWIQIVFGEHKDQRLGEMTDAEWETTLAVLNNGKQWEEMWRLAQKAPVFWSKQLLQKLKQVAWLPTVEEERVNFEKLKQLEEKCLEKIPPVGRLTYCQTTLSNHTDFALVSFSPDGKLLASCNRDRTIRLWQMPDGQPLARVLSLSFLVWQISFSPDGKLLAGVCYNEIKLWRISDWELLATLPNRGYEGFWKISFSPDGQILASYSGGTIRLWQMPDGKPLATLTNRGYERFSGISFSPDGQILASCSDDRPIKLWQMPDGKHFTNLFGHTHHVQKISFSPDGQILASCSDDRTIKLWQMPDGKPLATLSGHSGSVREISFSPDGRILASFSSDGTIRLWSSVFHLPIKHLCQQNRDWVHKTLQDYKISKQDRHWLEFMQALMDSYQRFDVEVEDAPQLISTSEFDIEIEE